MIIIKCICLILVLIISIIIGFSKANKYSRRYEELGKVSSGVSLFKTKIEYTNENIESIFTEISEVVFNNNENIFSNTINNKSNKVFNSKWDKSIEDNLNLNNSDREILKMFGKNLGKLDKNGQIMQIHEILKLLEVQIKEAANEKNRNVKMYRSLGIIIGIGIDIILI